MSYEVRRGGELLADIDGTSYFDGNREIGLEYLYSVTAVRDDGQRSAAATIIATAFGGIDPSSVESFFAAALPAVEGLRADVYSQTAAEIFWQQGDIAVPVRYELSRNDRVLGEFEGTSFFDGDLAPGIRYDYAVVAIGPGDIRSTPAFVTFITPGVASAAPGNTGVIFDIDHVVYSNTALELFWPDFDGSASTGFRYDVYQDGELVAVVDGQSYFADGLNPGQSYEFQVFVFDVRNLQVANSRVVQVTTVPRGPSEIIEPVPGESIAGRPFVEGTRISWRGPGG